MSRVIWTPLAEAELEDILYFIAVEGGRPETARRLGEEIRDAAEEYLQLGAPVRRHPALPAQWAYLMHKRWLIAVEQTTEGLTVHRVVDAVRDLPQQFQD